ncbi:acyl carrier protein [Zooshikella marina]|uniref:acyl carrier protein n=1 Tax=Zooshikella ganghwensis TaxID=202772 RepID=UPI001BB028DD|nr:acyl carrier protein [Zooshikella ganghwensis]MBU2704835.1 acyl carrier protein [Zooshikella ganghwensis]
MSNEKVNSIYTTLAEYLEIPVSELKESTSLENELLLDSTELICIIAALEKTMNIDLQNVPFEDWVVINDIVKAVEQKVREVM